MNDKKRFTLRLNEEEYKELSRIKGLTGTKTNTKAIQYLISHFVELNNRYIVSDCSTTSCVFDFLLRCTPL